MLVVVVFAPQERRPSYQVFKNKTVKNFHEPDRSRLAWMETNCVYGDAPILRRIPRAVRENLLTNKFDYEYLSAALCVFPAHSWIHRWTGLRILSCSGWNYTLNQTPTRCLCAWLQSRWFDIKLNPSYSLVKSESRPNGCDRIYTSYTITSWPFCEQLGLRRVLD